MYHNDLSQVYVTTLHQNIKISMKKTIITSLIALGGILAHETTYGQLQKGNLLLGGNIGNINFGSSINPDESFSMSFSPKVGYFIVDNLAIGLAHPWYASWGSEMNSSSNAFSVFGRYYFNDAKTIVLNKARFFVELETGFGTNRTKYKPVPSYVVKNSYGIFDVEAGFAYFLTSNVALEAALKLENTFYATSSNTALGIRLGFQIHLPTARMKEAYYDVKNRN